MNAYTILYIPTQLTSCNDAASRLLLGREGRRGSNSCERIYRGVGLRTSSLIRCGCWAAWSHSMSCHFSVWAASGYGCPFMLQSQAT